eukprot:19079-Chlamydomonas_euryale.AAC.1
MELGGAEHVGSVGIGSVVGKGGRRSTSGAWGRRAHWRCGLWKCGGGKGGRRSTSGAWGRGAHWRCGHWNVWGGEGRQAEHSWSLRARSTWEVCAGGKEGAHRKCGDAKHDKQLGGRRSLWKGKGRISQE